MDAVRSAETVVFFDPHEYFSVFYTLCSQALAPRTPPECRSLCAQAWARPVKREGQCISFGPSPGSHRRHSGGRPMPSLFAPLPRPLLSYSPLTTPNRPRLMKHSRAKIQRAHDKTSKNQAGGAISFPQNRVKWHVSKRRKSWLSDHRRALTPRLAVRIARTEHRAFALLHLPTRPDPAPLRLSVSSSLPFRITLRHAHPLLLETPPRWRVPPRRRLHAGAYPALGLVALRRGGRQEPHEGPPQLPAAGAQRRRTARHRLRPQAHRDRNRLGRQTRREEPWPFRHGQPHRPRCAPRSQLRSLRHRRGHRHPPPLRPRRRPHAPRPPGRNPGLARPGLRNDRCAPLPRAAGRSC